LVLCCLIVINFAMPDTVVFGNTVNSLQKSDKLDKSLQTTLLKNSFLAAKPVWPQGRETEMNLFVGFRAVFSKPDASEKQVGRVLDAGRNGSADITLCITGSSIYRIFLNGEFVGHGPARGPHGYWRVDNRPLKGIRQGKNVIAIEAAGYNADSYYLLDQPSFIQAEVICGDKVLVATGNEKTVGENTAAKIKFFEAFILKGRVQKVERYSFQRPFIEYYNLGSGFGKRRSDCSVTVDTVRCAEFRKPYRSLFIQGHSRDTQT